MILLICNLLIPVIMLITGKLMWKHYPKNINGFIGYRTTRSMMNMDTWNFANEYCGHLWYKMGIVMLVLSIIISIFIYTSYSYNYSMYCFNRIYFSNRNCLKEDIF